MKQYIISNNLSRAGRRVSRYSFSIEDAHTTVAHGCLSDLLYVDEKVNRSSITNFPLAAYAPQYLVIHISFPNFQRCVRDALERLLDPHKPHFAIWIWIYDVDENWTIDDLGDPITATSESIIQRLSVRPHLHSNQRGDLRSRGIQRTANLLRNPIDRSMCKGPCQHCQKPALPRRIS
ncbi:hypothetical protein B0F90DRAFT_604262 [Multifurca ochricompacta]|uniref:Uncharacterized protein n=1 Tax=Multifurca ochricompacta TaxID=376703 RepID=A0AAD4QGY4_9AGAM|nr:hypothetical protein B0F90DRAFT_604262 [Multifurca ochricompacta]